MAALASSEQSNGESSSMMLSQAGSPIDQQSVDEVSSEESDIDALAELQTSGPSIQHALAQPERLEAPHSDWALKEELRGSRGQYYRGPLSAAEVKALLATELSENARLALTSGHGRGYLRYFHFLGFKGEGSDVRERWQCRSCHSYLHQQPNKIGNLGTHLYGTLSGKKTRPGCLDDRRADPAEQIPPPPRDASGALVRQGASKQVQRKPIKRKRQAQPERDEAQADTGSSSSSISMRRPAESQHPPAAGPIMTLKHRTSSETQPQQGPSISPKPEAAIAQSLRGNPPVQPFFFIATSTKLNILSSTHPVTILLGWKEDELLGRDITELVHPAERSAVRHAVDPVGPRDGAELIAALIGAGTGAESGDGDGPAQEGEAGKDDRDALSPCWLSSTDFPGTERIVQCRLLHANGLYDLYTARVHFSRPDKGASPHLVVVWTMLKPGNDCDFPALLPPLMYSRMDTVM
ncbi:hypothetical protein OC842_004938 [Tilletia horrida]|uniref:PAS domain-containing protein n=1 Tax=Tilletia horrida TaxID=155126 RepID=A0AAN6G8Q3_9BASI|nr:hypothetical protein OC842_004938 [Tilletia horrida]